MNLSFYFVFLMGRLLFFDHFADAYSSNFSKEEIEIITKGNENEPMRILQNSNGNDSVFLRKMSVDLNVFSDTLITKLKNRMLTTVQNPADPGVGLAAVQIGIPKKIICVQRFDKKGFPFEFYCNARITHYSDSFKWRPDGCLSIPNLSGKSLRSIWIQISYSNIYGQVFLEKISDEFTAHIFQHEIDHQEGILWIDRNVIRDGMKVIN